MDKIDILKGAVSKYDNYCDGYGNPGNSGNNYLLGVVLEIGKVNVSMSHKGSLLLDKINAFDIAEVQSANIGQINMIKVSSFCGPQGLIWGYDLARNINLAKEVYTHLTTQNGVNVPVYSLEYLATSTQELFGTVDNKLFPIMPGSHVPTAVKSYYSVGPKNIYASLAIGIPHERSNAACLLMEDVGYYDIETENKISDYRKLVIENLIQSIIKIGKNQRVTYKEIYVGLKDEFIEENEVGCSLIAAPYFTIARNALPTNIEVLVNGNNEDWKASLG